MAVPLIQQIRVGAYVCKQRIMGNRRYPLVLMLEPLLRCNLACPGCGKIAHPEEVLNRNLSVEECIAAAEECGAPIVSIPGGEPLLHKEIEKIVDLQLHRGAALVAPRGVRLEWTGGARRLLAERAFDPVYGARPLKRNIQKLVQDPLALRILSGDGPGGAVVSLDADLSGAGVDFSISTPPAIPEA
ncbi:MAG: hypothetical protein KJ062_09205 [Thermoanaerobaculia bacterium]|nr:hypothetical protein [Thermoanaerobaculia bacterium]